MTEEPKLDIWTQLKLSQLERKRRREKRAKREERFEKMSFEEQVSKRTTDNQNAERQKRIKDLIETIKALQMLKADCSKQREELNQLLKPQK